MNGHNYADKPPADAAYQMAINTKDGWKKHMAPRANEAEDFLWNLGRVSYSKCDLCGTGAQGLETHLVGQNHWKKLGEKFNWNLPPPEVAEDTSRPWVEKIPTPKGTYLFNHITGRHGFDNGGAPAQVSPSAAAPVPAPAYQAPPVAQPYPQAASCGGVPVAPSSTASQDVNDAYRNALMSRTKGDWRRFMEPLANAASEELTRLTGSWDYACPICEQQNTRGLSDHVPSDKHWKALGNKLHWVPPAPEEAHASDKPWVQRINTCRGMFCFNHLTGAHYLEGQAPQPQVLSAAPAPAPTPAPGPPAPCSGVAPASSAEPKFSYAHWLFVDRIRTAAQQVDEVVYHASFGGSPPACLVCPASQQLTQDHISSLAHFEQLQCRCATLPTEKTQGAMEGDNSNLEDSSSPWVQKLQLCGQDYYFNHLTGKELWPARKW
eukprot:TRINITY_DN22637_c0_g1_i1.p1 TRINITY_DN22637_c0_g1~~TRINITY_DN22637_c0_g1_i1.p1  ORF type:complete len:435 (-),score=80.29 TRINITY_DN22637_c0_g1_i1:229-1533(-)